MDSYYFLHTGSLCDIGYEAYKAGLTELNSLTLEMLDNEIILKNDAIYYNPLYEKLFSDNAETGVIIQFIEQCTLVDNDIDNDAIFEVKYPCVNAGFFGVNFRATTGIASQRQVVDEVSLCSCRKYFLDGCIKTSDDKDLPDLLRRRFPKFRFSIKAQEDLLWWKHKRIEVMDIVIDLLDDITSNPFTGGFGKTEVLSNTKIPIASKRITHADRLTYTFGEETTIHRCKEHY